MALSSVAKEATYIGKLLKEIQLHNNTVITIQSDNMEELQLVKNPIYYARCKHIDIKYHHVTDLYEEKRIDLKYCSSNNVLSNNLQKVNNERFPKLLGLVK